MMRAVEENALQGLIGERGQRVQDIERAIHSWMTQYVADLFGLASQNIDSSRTFNQYGLDSSAAVGLAGDLGNWIGCDVDATAAYDHPSIDELARALANDPAIQTAFIERHGVAATRAT